MYYGTYAVCTDKDRAIQRTLELDNFTGGTDAVAQTNRRQRRMEACGRASRRFLLFYPSELVENHVKPALVRLPASPAI